MRRVILILVLTAGCAGSRQITDLAGNLPADQAGVEHHATVDTVLQHYFTDEAYEAIKDIPLIDGPAMSGYAAGTTFLSNLFSLVTFNGWGRKVIFPLDILREQWGVEGIVHEYWHHLDDMDREGTLDLIDHDAFFDAFLRLERDFHYAYIAIIANRKYAEFSWFYHAFISVGDLSERIAYVAGYMARAGKGPDYMWDVLERIIRRPE